MRIDKITPALGCYVTGLDLSRDLGAEDAAGLKTALNDNLVVFIRGQSPGPHQFLALGEQLGAAQPSVNLRSMEGELSAIHWIETDGTHARGAFADVWHSDVSWAPEPPSHILLRTEILPRLGGDTLWINMEAAYEALNDRTKTLIEGLQALHRIEPSGDQLKNRSVDKELLRSVPDYYFEGSVHPVVRVHPETGRKSLYVNPCFTRSIVGLSPVESQALLRLLFDHSLLPDFQMRLRWEDDLVVIWDNRATMHYAVNDYRELRRHWRLTVGGERPFGPGSRQR